MGVFDAIGGFFEDVITVGQRVLETPTGRDIVGGLIRSVLPGRDGVIVGAAGGPPAGGGLQRRPAGSTVAIPPPVTAGRAFVDINQLPGSGIDFGAVAEGLLGTGGGPALSVFGGRSVQVGQPVAFGPDPTVPNFFPSRGERATPARFIIATNPVTGNLTYWEHAGRPVLMSRDLAVVKRVRRIASKAGTVTRRRCRKR